MWQVSSEKDFQSEIILLFVKEVPNRYLFVNMQSISDY